MSVVARLVGCHRARCRARWFSQALSTWVVDTRAVNSGAGRHGIVEARVVDVAVIDMGVWAGWGYCDIGAAR